MKVALNKDHLEDWHTVCGNCKHFDGTQTWNHCCQIHIHTQLLHGNPCNDFDYDDKCYTMEYDEDYAGLFYGELYGEDHIPWRELKKWLD